VNPAHGARRTLRHKSAFDFFPLIIFYFTCRSGKRV